MPTYGYLPDSFDERDIWADEVLAGNVSRETIPASYRTEGLSFEPQGAWPFCASMCVTKMVERFVKNRTGENHDLSQPHLFFNSGGSERGSTFRGNLETARRDGLLHFAMLPMPGDLYDLSKFAEFSELAKKTPFDGARKITGYVRVSTTREALKSQILASGMVLAGVAASGGYWADRAKRPKGKPDNHAVLLVGWDEDGSWWVFDSLQPKKGFDGYHRLDADYGFNSAYAVTELPGNWKEVVAEKRTPPPNNANHYGKRRDLELEKRVAVQMLDEFEKLGNRSVLEAAGRFWVMYVNAVAYGGYSLSYRKWGTWQPGDILNDCYMWRRTGQHIFDFDKLRNEYK